MINSKLALNATPQTFIFIMLTNSPEIIRLRSCATLPSTASLLCFAMFFRIIFLPAHDAFTNLFYVVFSILAPTFAQLVFIVFAIQKPPLSFLLSVNHPIGIPFGFYLIWVVFLPFTSPIYCTFYAISHSPHTFIAQSFTTILARFTVTLIHIRSISSLS